MVQLFTSSAKSTGKFTAKESTTDNGDGLDLAGDGIESLEIIDVAEQG
jgi:hypothetical protein